MAVGTFDYAADTVAGTVDIPAGSFLQRVTVLADGATTITIGGGDTITVIAGASFSEEIGGLAVDTSVVIGGDPASYYVAWKLGN